MFLEERQNFQLMIARMRPYLLPVLKLKYGDKCDICQETFPTYDIHHLRYAEDITVFDLRLQCHPCHLQTTQHNTEMFLTRTPHCTTCKCWEQFEED